MYIWRMIDRSAPPPIREISHLGFEPPDVRIMSGGIPMYILPGPSEGLLKLEVIFLAGRMDESIPMTARAACRLMREGTTTLTSAEIAEITDTYGGTISSSDSMDHNGLMLQCLTRFLPDLLPVFSDLLLHPSFPEKEIQSFIRNQSLRLEEDLSKNEVVAYRELTALLFGADHPYGYNSTAELYRKLERTAIAEFWERHFRAGNALLFLSGQFSESDMAMIDQQLCRPMRPGGHPGTYRQPAPDHRQLLQMPGSPALQCAIRIGRRLFNRLHPDFHPLQAANLILGGYFGSRLMTQIREELGLTYNIYSHIDVMRHDGYFYISAEVSKEEAARTRTEIYREMERLRDEKVEEDELLMMQRFFAGNMLHLLDGPFSKSETFRNLVVDGADHRDFNRMVERVRNVTPETVLEMARKWFDPAAMSEVLVGT